MDLLSAVSLPFARLPHVICNWCEAWRGRNGSCAPDAALFTATATNTYAAAPTLFQNANGKAARLGVGVMVCFEHIGLNTATF